ncbi:hypothetical protein T439DRAFT_321549 [Meredithblackwellia eburnea MCA 4105]
MQAGPSRCLFPVPVSPTRSSFPPSPSTSSTSSFSDSNSHFTPTPPRHSQRSRTHRHSQLPNVRPKIPRRTSSIASFASISSSAAGSSPIIGGALQTDTHYSPQNHNVHFEHHPPATADTFNTTRTATARPTAQSTKDAQVDGYGSSQRRVYKPEDAGVYHLVPTAEGRAFEMRLDQFTKEDQERLSEFRTRWIGAVVAAV